MSRINFSRFCLRFPGRAAFYVECLLCPWARAMAPAIERAAPASRLPPLLSNLPQGCPIPPAKVVQVSSPMRGEQTKAALNLEGLF